MIFKFMKSHANEFKIEKMAQVFKVSRDGYYKYLRQQPSVRKIENQALLSTIRVIHKKSRELYGSPRVHSALKKLGKKYSRKRVAKIMQQNGIQSKIKKRWKTATKGTKDLTLVVSNLLNQNFTVNAPDRVWVSDITYIKTKTGWLYLATTLDLFSRKIIGFSMSDRIDTNLVIQALAQAVCHRVPSPGLIHHSDRGTQYTSNAFKEFIRKCGMRQSMSGRGNCYDNAVMESFYHTIKTEHVAFCDFKTREEAQISIFEYIEVFYNRERTHSTLQYQSPAQFELRYLEGLNLTANNRVG